MALRFLVLVVIALLSAGYRVKVQKELQSSDKSEDGDGNIVTTKNAWKERVLTCDTPWTGLKTAAANAAGRGMMNVSLGQYVVDQIQERISTEGYVINQGWEGLCTIVAVENILVLKDPERFANIVADLYCTGVVGKDRRIGTEIHVSSEVLGCTQTAKAEGKVHRGSNALFHLEDPRAGKIRVVDWLFAAPLADAAKRFSTPCGRKSGQGQRTAGYTAVSKWIFPTSHMWQEGHASLSLTSFARGMVGGAQHLRTKEWSAVLKIVRDGGQAILGLNPDQEDYTMTNLANHAVVLTKVVDSSLLTDKCAASILSEFKDKASCVIWTWAKYYAFEDCDNLRKITQDAVIVLPEEGKIGPLSLQRTSFFEEIEFNLKSAWFFRRTRNWKPPGLTFVRRSFKFLKQQDFEFVPRLKIGKKQQEASLMQDHEACMQTINAIKACLPCGLWPGREIRLNHRGANGVWIFDAYGIISEAGNPERTLELQPQSVRPLSTLSVGSIVSYGSSERGIVTGFQDRVRGQVKIKSGTDYHMVPRNKVQQLFMTGDTVSYKEQLATITGLDEHGETVKIRIPGEKEIQVPFESISKGTPESHSCILKHAQPPFSSDQCH